MTNHKEPMEIFIIPILREGVNYVRATSIRHCCIASFINLPAPAVGDGARAPIVEKVPPKVERAPGKKLLTAA